MKKRRNLVLFIICLVLIFCWYFKKPKELLLENFSYPIDDDISIYVNQLKSNKTSDIYPINLFDYEFDHIPNCKLTLHKKEEKIRFLTIIVKSSVKNFARRLAIRQTWGSQDIYNDIQIRTLFNLGRLSGSEEAVRWEASRYRDIIQSNFQDTYLNLTIKTVMGMKYAYHYCQSTDYFILLDDDIFASINNILKVLPQNSNITFYSGYVHKNPGVNRNPFSKWYISYKDYPYSIFPNFVNGPLIMLTKNTLQNLYLGSYFTKLIHLEDVFLGIVAFKMRIQPIANYNFYQKKYYVGQKSYKNVLGSHSYDNIEEMMSIWAEHQHQNT